MSMAFAQSLEGRHSFTPFADGTRTHFTKLLLLDFLQNSLFWWIEVLKVKSALDWDMGDWPLQYGRPPTSKFAERYIKDFLYHERIMDHTQNLTDAIEYVLLSLSAVTNKSVLPSSQSLQERIVDIRAKCTQQTRLVSRIMERRVRRYDLFVNNLNIHESSSLKRLSILAAFFLPLSLATGILSMQTRFVNLNLLLYDFLGVFCLITSIAVLAYLIFRISTKISKTEIWARNKRYTPWKIRWWSSKAMVLFAKYLMYFYIWAVITVSFFVGMVVQVPLGLKVLAYGFGALTGIVLLFSIMGVCCVICSTRGGSDSSI
jgi:hypothetical protein